jgi:hypothetical protein
VSVAVCVAGVVVFEEHFIDISFHGESACAFCIVPFDVNSCKLGTGPVSGDFVVLLQGLKEVVCVAPLHVLDAKVVDDKDECNWAPFVSTKAWCGHTLVVSVGGESFREEIVCELTCLFQSIHSIINFKVYPTVVFVFGEVLFIGEFLWDVQDFDAYVF